MRAHGRTDGNHADVVKALRDAGMTVQTLAAVGGGCPDLLVGWRGMNVLLEVKNGGKTPGDRRVTVAQTDWHGTWGGQVGIVLTPEEAVTTVIEYARQFGCLPLNVV